MKHVRLRLPTKSQIERVVKAARSAGLDVSGFRIEPDGSIVVFDKSATPKDEFATWLESRPN